ncbi:hypothetical protein IMY97_23435 [Pectobacterium versatile]|uniref:hypothetical protein n=1 Tax=Pectobacterium versatile TaxID=2488639 RepID=UPI001FA7CDCE|nr:hypothetical protein [Pectobacterium versatile]UNE78821.1 hypothetical protein IMY97_23435 [Pectobacterium versatile]
MSIIKRCAGLIAAMAVFATASPVFAQANLKEEKVLIVVSSLDKKKHPISLAASGFLN